MNFIEKSKLRSVKTKRKIHYYLAGLISFSLLITMIGPMAVFSNSPVEAETISDWNAKQAEVTKKLEEIRKEKEALKNLSNKLVGDLSWLNSETDAKRKEYQGLVEDKNNAYIEMQNSLAEAKKADEDVIAKQAQFTKSMQVMFENRNKSTLEMLFDAKDIKGFLANVQLIAIIADSNKKILNELISAKDEAMLKKKAAEEHCAEMQTYVDQKNADIKKLKADTTKTAEEIQETKAALEKAEQEEAAQIKASNEINAAIKRLQSSGGYYGGTMGWPTPGYTGINPGNGFGMRMHPIYHYMRMHSGIDINAPFDSKIDAAADGKVIIASTIPGYNPISGNNYGGTNYGNYIVIDHGGGISSLYGHCKLLKVKVGDTVKARQWIAVTGSTGLSTGAHLHFEIRENGTPVDPLQTKYLGVKK